MVINLASHEFHHTRRPNLLLLGSLTIKYPQYLYKLVYISKNEIRNHLILNNECRVLKSDLNVRVFFTGTISAQT